MKFKLYTALLAFQVLSLRFFFDSPQKTAAAEAGVRPKPCFSEMTAMRDGVKLSTDICLPAGDGPWPVILTRTPYSKDALTLQQHYWTTHGYAYVIQNCRGRMESEGKFLPFLDDHLDGFDAVEWAAGQTWSNSRIGMIGDSAMGITANQASIMAPPHLRAMYVQEAPASGYQHATYTGGVFRKELNEQWLKSMAALDALDLSLKHYRDDGYLNIREGRLHWEKVRVPVYNVGGWYDIFSQGAIDNFVGLQSKGGGLALGNQKLLMGPWSHGLTDDVPYPRASADQAKALRWFDYWLKNIQNGVMQEAPVTYYVMGDIEARSAPGNEWRTAISWPVPAKTTSYFLQPDGALSEEPAVEAGRRSYRYDPRNPVPTAGGQVLFGQKGPVDQRRLGVRTDVLKFATPPLKTPIEVTGPVAVELWAESDCADTDWMAKLIDVYPDGTERLVLDSAVRARFRDGFDREVFMKAGEVNKFKLDLWSTSLVFNKGHRIAVHITSSNSPRFDPNPNTGKPPRSSDDLQAATNTIHFSSSHTSRILLPVVQHSAFRRPPAKTERRTLR